MLKNEKKKKILTIIITIIVSGVLVILLPFLYFWGDIFVEMIFDKPNKPITTYGEFPFELVYEYNGEQKTIKDTIICEYDGTSFALDGGNSRKWTCVIKNNHDYGRYMLDENISNLYIQIPLEADYYMGDKNVSSESAKPYIYYADENTGTMYYEQDLTNVIGARIISWKAAEPLEDNFK